LKPRAGTLAQQARSPATAWVAKEEEAENDAELLYPRVEAVTV